MKTSIPNERLFDPRLRAFVAQREYIEAMRYYRNQYQASRAEASEAIDFVREQIEKERDQGAAPATIAVWSHPTDKPQPTHHHVSYETVSEPEEDEEVEDSSTETTDETIEEFDDPDENLNSSPYELPGTYGRPELEPVHRETSRVKDEDESEEEPNEDEEDDLFDDDNEIEEFEEDDEEETETDDEPEDNAQAVGEEEAPVVSPETPKEPEAVIEEKESPPPLPIQPTAPVVVPVVAAPMEPPPGLPSWESLSNSMRRELVSMSLHEAIRFYWSETGCSLADAKVFVSFWLSQKH